MSSPKPLSKDAYHHGNLRGVLIDEAAKMLSKDGETALSMRKLSAKIGVSRTAAYHHFDNKYDLLCAIAEEGFLKFLQLHSQDQQTIAEFVKSYLQFSTQNPEYYDLMFGSYVWKSDKLTESLKESAYESFRIYVDRIDTWQKAGLISDTMEPLRYAQVSWGALHGMSRLLIDGIYIDDEAVDMMSQSLVRFFSKAG